MAAVPGVVAGPRALMAALRGRPHAVHRQGGGHGHPFASLTITPSLLDELAWLGLELQDLGGGYKVVVAGLYVVYIVAIGEVAAHERDAFLSLFGPMPQNDPEARRWFVKFLGKEKGQMSMQDMQGYQEVLRQFVADLPPEHRMLGLSPEERLKGLAPEERLAGLAPEERLVGLAPEERLAGLAPEERLAGLAPEERLAGLAPEERLAGLAPEERLLLVPDDVLRALPASYLATLSPATRDAIGHRLGACAA